MNPDIDLLESISTDLIDALRPLKFGPPISHVYNPLEYARESLRQYHAKFASVPKEVLLLGMNPGPWGMAQTGIPFGEIQAVRDWMKIQAPVGSPKKTHPKRPVLGFACTKREVSGQRLWGWAQKTFRTPERFFKRFFVANYCPLIFIENSGRNRTPDQIRVVDRKPLLEICDRALGRTIEYFKPRYVVGVGKFAEQRARAALDHHDVKIGMIAHPSPANPQANRGWEPLIEKQLKALGIKIGSKK
ncbi:MAG: single-stranded DNA-binding protein [Desulfobacterales bacterium]|jgi:single-strand selective monofunctional uracil DNA glycosylase